MSLAGLLAIALVGCAGDDTDDTDGAQVPELVSSTPGDGDTGFPVDGEITLEFSAPLDPEAAEGAFSLEVPFDMQRDEANQLVEVGFRWEGENRTMIATPTQDLPYSCVLGVALQGDPSVPEVWFAFTVAEDPEPSSARLVQTTLNDVPVSPGDSPIADVPLETTFAFLYSHLMSAGPQLFESVVIAPEPSDRIDEVSIGRHTVQVTLAASTEYTLTFDPSLVEALCEDIDNDMQGFSLTLETVAP
jgi:hypothetical protein